MNVSKICPVSRSFSSTFSIMLLSSWLPCVVTLRTAAFITTLPPALAYSGLCSNCMLTIVPVLSPPPPPTANCTSSPTASCPAFCSCSFTTPCVSVSMCSVVGMLAYAPPVENASLPSFSGVSEVGTALLPPPPNSTQGFKSAGLMSSTVRVNW